MSDVMLADDSAAAGGREAYHTIDSFLISVADEFGPYQRRHYAIVGLSWVSVGMSTLLMVLTSKPPQWRLLGEPDEQTSTAPPPCDEAFEIVDEWTTASGEWQLVCDRVGLAALASTLYFVGFGLGAFLIGSLADRIGRRMSCKLAAAISTVTVLASAAASSPELYAACRLAAGFGIGGLSTSSYVLATEVIGPSWQGVVGVGMSLIFSVGEFLLVPLSLLLPSWRALTVATAVPCLLQYFAMNTVDESPRWLLANGHTDRAAAVLQAVAIGNGVNCPSAPLLSLASQLPTMSDAAEESEGNSTNAEASKKSVGALFSSNLLRGRTLGMLYCWFAASFAYYGLSLNSGNLGGTSAILPCLSPSASSISHPTS